MHFQLDCSPQISCLPSPNLKIPWANLNPLWQEVLAFFLNSNLKRSKLTEFLYDLVVPKEEPSSTAPSVDNPLQKMQDLVNMKLNSKTSSTSLQKSPISTPQQHPKISAFNTTKQGLCTSVVNAAGSLLALSSSVSSSNGSLNCRKSPEQSVKSPNGNGKSFLKI